MISMGRSTLQHTEMNWPFVFTAMRLKRNYMATPQIPKSLIEEGRRARNRIFEMSMYLKYFVGLVMYSLIRLLDIF